MTETTIYETQTYTAAFDADYDFTYDGTDERTLFILDEPSW